MQAQVSSDALARMHGTGGCALLFSMDEERSLIQIGAARDLISSDIFNASSPPHQRRRQLGIVGAQGGIANLKPSRRHGVCSLRQHGPGKQARDGSDLALLARG